MFRECVTKTKLAAFINTKRTAYPKKIFIHDSIHCALEFIYFKEAHSILCVLLNVFTQQKVREWFNATGPPSSLLNPLPLRHGLFPCPSEKKKNKNNNPADWNVWNLKNWNVSRGHKHNLNFFSPMVNLGTSIYLFRSTDLSGTLQSAIKSECCKSKALMQMFYGYYARIGPVRPVYIN